MATSSRILAWKIPWTKEPERLQSRGLQRVGHDKACACMYTHTHARTHARTHTHTHTLTSRLQKAWVKPSQSISSTIKIIPESKHISFSLLQPFLSHQCFSWTSEITLKLVSLRLFFPLPLPHKKSK